MKKKDMLLCLEEALTYVLCQNLKESDEKKMRHSITLFINEVASQYTKEELQIKFNTPEESVTRFTKYLEHWGELIEQDDMSMN